MKNKRVIASVFLVGVLMFSSAQVRVTPTSVVEDTSAPSIGSTWIHDTTKDILHYSTDFNKWISTPTIWISAFNGSDKTGFMKVHNALTDTTTGDESGVIAKGRMRIISAGLTSNGGDAPNCTTYVFADQDTIVKLAWKGAAQNLDIVPAADSSTAWILPSARAIINDGQVLSTSIKANGSSPDNPDNPIIMLWMVREEDP